MCVYYCIFLEVINTINNLFVGIVTLVDLLKFFIIHFSELIPYFGSSALSYALYPVMKDAYTNFDIELTFKPETTDGNY